MDEEIRISTNTEALRQIALGIPIQFIIVWAVVILLCPLFWSIDKEIDWSWQMLLNSAWQLLILFGNLGGLTGGMTWWMSKLTDGDAICYSDSEIRFIRSGREVDVVSWSEVDRVSFLKSSVRIRYKNRTKYFKLYQVSDEGGKRIVENWRKFRPEGIK